MSFVRSGPRILIVETKAEPLFRSFLTSHFSRVEITEKIKTFEDIISLMNHHQTLIYISDNAHEPIGNFEVERCIILEDSAQSFLMKALNCSSSNLISHVKRAPRIIIMKVIGNIEKTVSEIADDFKASVEQTKTVLNVYSEGTVILFTKGNLNKKLEFTDLYQQCVYTQEHFSDTINMLDHHSLKYINRSGDTADWCNMTINIRDKFEDYKAHYNRLIYVLDCLGAGMILKEGWSEDTGLFFTSNAGYKVVLYTYLSAVEIKKILIALEYMENHERIVDFDLFDKKKKVHWDDVKIKGITTREDLSSHYRQTLYKSLAADDIEYIRSQEDYIFACR